MNYETAYRIARDLADELSPACKKIEIAGGLRRKKQDPHDIELVAIPTIDPKWDMFGHEVGERNLLDEALADLVERGELRHGPKNGPRFKQFVTPSGLMVDLFIVRYPAQWGVIYAIRTGPAHYSHWLVTKREKGGPLPNDTYVQDGAVWYEGHPLPMESEEAFYAFLQIPMPAPQDRVPNWGNSKPA